MKDYQYKFIKYLLHKQVLQFGKFTLNSGRVSPYFFNTSLLNTGCDLVFLGEIYARALIDSKIKTDVLFGAAYKGIPIIIATAIVMEKKYKYKIPFCFNRKELKNHGEKGKLVGSKLYGNIVLLDDVITSGNTIHESIKIINIYNAILSGIIVSFDRQEKGQDHTKTAIQEIRQRYNCKVVSIINLFNLISYIEKNNVFNNQLDNLYSYREQYCYI